MIGSPGLGTAGGEASLSRLPLWLPAQETRPCRSPTTEKSSNQCSQWRFHNSRSSTANQQKQWWSRSRWWQPVQQLLWSLSHPRHRAQQQLFRTWEISSPLVFSTFCASLVQVFAWPFLWSSMIKCLHWKETRPPLPPPSSNTNIFAK